MNLDKSMAPLRKYLTDLISSNEVQFKDLRFKQLDDHPSTSLELDSQGIHLSRFSAQLYRAIQPDIEREDDTKLSPAVKQLIEDLSELPLPKRHKSGTIDRESAFVPKAGPQTYIHDEQLSEQAFERLQQLFKSLETEKSLFVQESPSTPFLSELALLQFEDLLTRIFDGKLDSKPYDSAFLNIGDLTRLQSLCTVPIHLLLDRPELPFARTALIASLVLFTIFLSGRQEPELFRGEYIEPAVKAVVSLAHREPNIAVQVARKIAKYIGYSLIRRQTVAELSEDLLTKLEYFSIGCIFGSDANLRPVSMDILVNIFAKQPSQRSFILDEIMANFGSLGGKYRLPDGLNVDHTVILILRLIQTYDLTSYVFSIPIWKDFLFKNTHLETFESSVFITDPATGKIKISSREKATFYREVVSFEQFVRAQREFLENTCARVASFLVEKADSSPGSKPAIESFVKDLLSLVDRPEWAGSESLLVAIMNTFVYVFQAKTYSAAVESFVLEMIGLIGDKILAIKRNSGVLAPEEPNTALVPSIAIATDKFDAFTSSQESCLSYLESLTDKDHFFNAGRAFFFSKWIDTIASLRSAFLETSLKEVESLGSDELSRVQVERVAEKKLVSSSALFSRVHSQYLLFLATIGDNNPVDTKPDPTGFTKYPYILCSQTLVSLHDSFIEVVLLLLTHPKVKSRSRAVKNLAAVVRRDPEIMKGARIRRTIIERATDISALVRDAVTDLLCQYAPQARDQELCEVAILRILDASSAVRRRVLGSVSSIYEVCSPDLRTKLFSNLLGALLHEDALLSELVSKTLAEALFLPCVHGEDVLPTLKALAKAIKPKRQKEQFERFLHRAVLSDTSKMASHRRKVAFTLSKEEMHTALKIYVESIVDYVVADGAMKTDDEITQLLVLLLSLSECDPSLVTQEQLVLLLPFVSQRSTCAATLSVFRHVLPSGRAFRPEFIADTHMLLLRKLTKFQGTALGEAVACIWALTELGGDILRVASACILCLRLLHTYIESVQKGTFAEGDGRWYKLINLVGHFGRFCNFEPRRSQFLAAQVGLKEGESITSVLSKYIIVFCKDELPLKVRETLISSLLLVCGTHPKLFLLKAVLGVMDREFERPSNTDIQMALVAGLTDFLSTEPPFDPTENTVHKSSDLRLDVDIFHGKYSLKEMDGIAAPLVQRYLEKVVQLCDGKGLYTFVLFLEAAVRQGFANPRLVISKIIALEFSENSDVRAIAVELHREIHNKHETLVESQYVEGLKQAFQGPAAGSEAFESFYRVLSTSRASKKKFVSSLLRALERIDANHTSYKDTIQYKAFVEGVILRISEADLSTLEEYYILCQGINRLLHKQGATVQDLYDVYQDDETPEKWARLACLASALNVLFTFKEHVCDRFNISEEDLRAFNGSKVDKELKEPIVRNNAGDFECEYMPTSQFGDLEVCRRVVGEFVYRYTV